MMGLPIDSIASTRFAELVDSRAPSKTDSSGFGDTLATALESVADAERDAESASIGFANGDPNVGIHEVVISAERASIALRFAATMKSRLLESYREIMNTQI